MDELRYQVDLLNAINQKLTNDEKMYRLICNTSNSAFIYQDLKENVIRTAGNWSFYFDFTIKEFSDITILFGYVEENYITALRDLLDLEKFGLKRDSAIIKLRDSQIWVECEAAVIYDDFGIPLEKVLRFKNITKLKNQNDELTYMAYYDVLTGLYNRNYFVRLLGDFIRKAEAANDIISVMFIDIDDFRKVNDSMGIIIGDEIMQQFGQFLSEFKSEQVLVSHFNGDIYCIAIYNPFGNRSVEAIHKAIQKRLGLPFSLSTGQEVTISVSVGVAEYPEAARTTLELINCAEIVMFKAKSSGSGTIQFFDAPILQDFLNNVAIENKLKEAVFNQNFILHFQPQYTSNDKKLRGMETLIRWRDYDGKMISPMTFIPIAEKNGAIIPIGTWVIEESIRIYSTWKKTYRQDMILSLNISAIQYARNDFIDTVLSIISKYDVDPRGIELEITESVLINDFKDIREKLHILREYGIRISLDDFGTGFSSLSYLKGLPIDTLKIDKSFIDTVITDSNTRIITESIIYMVKKLGFETVAEGVETEEQFEYLKSIGCDCIQGYLLGRPMPPGDLEKDVLQCL